MGIGEDRIHDRVETPVIYVVHLRTPLEEVLDHLALLRMSRTGKHGLAYVVDSFHVRTHVDQIFGDRDVASRASMK
jgi:hypothetical protein